MSETAEPTPGSRTGSIDLADGPVVDQHKPAGFVRRWNEVARTWARLRLKGFGGQSTLFEAGLHEFTEVVGTAENSAAVEAALLRQAQRIVPAFRIELMIGAAASVAPETFPPGDREGSSDGGNMSRPLDGSNGQSILDVPLHCGSVVRGRLRVRPRARGVASLRTETIQRLTTLCTLSACALERLDHREGWPEGVALAQPGESAGADPASITARTGATFVNNARLHDATFLNAVLPFALNQARRHDEPLSLLCVAIDRLGGIQELLGRAAVDRLVQSVGETVATLIRASDIVARLDDDRIVAVLPRAPGGGAMHVAQKVCTVVAEKSHDDCEIPQVTVSIGVATFPSCADNVYSLFDAADHAMARAQSEGRNQASLAPRRLTIARSRTASYPS